MSDIKKNQINKIATKLEELLEKILRKDILKTKLLDEVLQME